MLLLQQQQHMEPNRSICLTPPLMAPPPPQLLALQIDLAPSTPTAAAGPDDPAAITIFADKCSPGNTSHDRTTTTSSGRTNNIWSSALLRQMPLIMDRFGHSSTPPSARRHLPPSTNRSTASPTINAAMPRMNLQSTRMEDEQTKKNKNMVVTSVVESSSSSSSGDDLEWVPSRAPGASIPAPADNLTVMIMDISREREGMGNYDAEDSSSSCSNSSIGSGSSPSAAGKGGSMGSSSVMRCSSSSCSSTTDGRRTWTTSSSLKSSGAAAVGIAWRDLWVTVSSGASSSSSSSSSSGGHAASKTVLHGVTGYAEAGKVVAIMGPSGCGKSTLLDALAGRLGKRARMSGEVCVNRRRGSSGKSACSWQQQGTGTSIAYVRQEDTLLGTLTVRETLTYSARMRMRRISLLCSSSSSSSERRRRRWSDVEAMVEEAMETMGLTESANTAVGNWHLRGLSGGEKRRLSIALEILTRPDLLFLDEPTSGLDSASAFFVIATLRRLARDGHRSIVAAIHQPSSQVFALFDSLCLLSDGRLVFFGDKDHATQHFANAGFPCPPHRNPSDHYLCSINSDFDSVKSSLAAQKLVGMEEPTTSSSSAEAASFPPPLEKMSSTEMANILVSRYTGSVYAEVARSRADEFITMMHEQRQEKKRKSSSTCGSIHQQQPAGNDEDAAAARAVRASIERMSVTFWTQTWTLTHRSFVNMRRDVGYYWLRLLIYILLTASIGSIYFQIGTTYQSVMARASCISYVTGFLTFMSIGGFPSFVEDMKVFSREQSNGHYGVVPFILANLLSALPYLSFISLVSSSICYFMVGLHPGITHFVYFVLCLLACLAVVESLMMVVASIVPNFLMGIITGAGIQGIFMLVAGFFRLPNDMPKPIWRYPLSYLSFHMYAMQGMYQNDFVGLKFEAGKWEGAPAVEGELILESMYEVDLKRSKWWNLWVLLVMVFMYRLIFLLVVKFSKAYDTWRQQSGGGNTNTAPSPSSSKPCSSSSTSSSSSPHDSSPHDLT